MTVQDNAPLPQMGQCSVTGKVVPEDELVTIHGHRVCAEGKAILLQRLHSGEALPGEQEKPTVMLRFGCYLLDGLIIFLPAWIAMKIVTNMTAGESAAPAMMGATICLVALLEIVYFGQMHGTRGQTVGKMAGKIAVVNLDGSPITLGTGYLRAFAYIGPNFLTGLAHFSGTAEVILVAAGIVGVYALTNIIFALVDSRQRALHDLIAGTRVVVIN